MIYNFVVEQGEFGFIARLEGEEKNLSGVGQTVWEAIEHLAGFLKNMKAIEDHPEHYIGGTGRDSL